MKTTLKYLGFSLVAVMGLASCSDEFLDEKKDFDQVGMEVYNNYAGADLRVMSIYGTCLPNPNATTGSPSGWSNSCTGLGNDDQCKASEEYAGFSIFVNPLPAQGLTSDGDPRVPDYFQYQQNLLVNYWGRIRNINDAIAGIEAGTLSQEEKNELLGQCYFFRAWCYYNFFKWYGGVPIIKEVVAAEAASYTPRSSAEEVKDFIIEDLETSALMLAAATTNGGWKDSGKNWGRITSGTALALKGRVLLLWASPLFNRSNDQARWTEAYSEMKEDLATINACGYDLYQEEGENAKGFASLFSKEKSCEAVFVRLANKFNQSNNDAGTNNYWERFIRPANTTGSGNFEASAMLVDMFPMKDGKIPSSAGGKASTAAHKTYTKLESSSIAYERDFPFMNRDPRFYRTFAFPGVRWAFDGDATGGSTTSNNKSYNNGHDYELWNYVWYTSVTDQGDVEDGTKYGADNLLKNVRGIYIRKRSDDYDINKSPMYNYDPANYGFTVSAAPYIELRYAEVLLNLAEAACGAGDMSYAVEQLQKIRARVGYTSENNYGLQSDLSGNQNACMAAILYERQIELAYEGKRFDDLRRWLLYDGGKFMTSIEGAPSTWKLTGWGGNTCEWLGFEPLNGQRRERMIFRTADEFGVGGETFDSDPIEKAGVARCAALDLNKPLDDQQEVLKAWYTQCLVRKDVKGDSRDDNKVDLYMNFRPRYYLLGFSIGAMNRNDKRLEQTIGWTNTNTGVNGTFDPLANNIE